MSNITASLVKDLREKTGAGMMDCKSALTETNGDVEAAIDLLRKKGILKAAKKSGRTAADGLVGVALAAGKGALVEVNAETDFVARNDAFQDLVRKSAVGALKHEGDVERLLAHPHEGFPTLAEAVTALVAKIGENMSVRRSAALSVSPGIVASYLHNAVASDLGKIGVLVALKSAADPDKLMALGKQLAMHVAAANPLATRVEELDPNVVARERAIHAEQAAGSPWRFVSMTLDEPGDADAPALSSIFDGDERIGLVTSAGWSFTLDKSVALGYVEPKYEAVGTKLEVEIFGNRVPVTVGSEPLFDPKNERLRS